MINIIPIGSDSEVNVSVTRILWIVFLLIVTTGCRSIILQEAPVSMGLEDKNSVYRNSYFPKFGQGGVTVEVFRLKHTMTKLRGPELPEVVVPRGC